MPVGELRHLNQCLLPLAYVHIPQYGYDTVWKKVETEDTSLVVTACRTDTQGRLICRISAQTTDVKHVVVLNGISTINMIEHIAQYECAVLNGLESLRRDL